MILAAVALLVSCGVPRPRPGPQQPPAAAAAARPPSGAHSYRIDSAQSELRVLVYRAGPMARFGHNHVMVNRAIGGSVDFEDSPSAIVVLPDRAGRRFRSR